MTQNEYFELLSLVRKQSMMLELLLPQKVSISYLCDQTGTSRQAITQFLYRNFEPESDFWKINGRIVLSQKVAFEILQRYRKNER